MLENVALRHQIALLAPNITRPASACT